MDERIKGHRIGVLCGGLSREREVSLRSGANVFDACQALGLDAVMIDVGRDLAAKLVADRITLAYVALHGRYGEDGCVQGLLEVLGIPYTGSGVLASAIGMDKVASKRVLVAEGIPTPDYAAFDRTGGLAALRAAAAGLGFPVVVKPACEGSSISVTIARDAAEFAAAAQAVLDDYGRGLAERFVKGTEITTGVLGTGPAAEALPVLQLVPKHAFYDYEAKYTQGLTDFILPAALPADTYNKAQAQAVAVHRAVGCRGLSRVDAMVDADGQPWAIEINTLPGMTATSDLPAQAAAAGMGFKDLVARILATALEPGT